MTTIKTSKGTAFTLTEKQRKNAISACQDGLKNARNIIDSATDEQDANLGLALSAAFRALLFLLTSERNQESDKPKKPDNKWRYYLE